jgi:uncharacterized membrane protein YoaT (DUF817 family)
LRSFRLPNGGSEGNFLGIPLHSGLFYKALIIQLIQAWRELLGRNTCRAL